MWESESLVFKFQVEMFTWICCIWFIWGLGEIKIASFLHFNLSFPRLTDCTCTDVGFVRSAVYSLCTCHTYGSPVNYGVSTVNKLCNLCVTALMLPARSWAFRKACFRELSIGSCSGIFLLFKGLINGLDDGNSPFCMNLGLFAAQNLLHGFSFCRVRVICLVWDVCES